MSDTTRFPVLCAKVSSYDARWKRAIIRAFIAIAMVPFVGVLGVLALVICPLTFLVESRERRS